MKSIVKSSTLSVVPPFRHLFPTACLALLMAGTAVAQVGSAPGGSGLVLWNRLGSTQEILNSGFGPNLSFYPGGDPWPEVKANPAYVSGVFGGALTIGPGNYGTYDRVHNVVLNNLDQVLDPNRGTVEVWYQQVNDPVANRHGIYRIFDGSFGLGSGMLLESHAYDGLRFGLAFGGTLTEVQSDITPFTGSWIHIAGVWDVNGIAGTSDRLRLYLDGQVVASSTLATWGSIVGNAADIGGGNDGDIAGQFAVDNLKVYDAALTDFSHRFQEDSMVPEPGAAALFALGSLLLLRVRQKRPLG